MKERWASACRKAWPSVHAAIAPEEIDRDQKPRQIIEANGAMPALSQYRSGAPVGDLFVDMAVSCTCVAT
jgi:hypothetical protein